MRLCGTCGNTHATKREARACMERGTLNPTTAQVTPHTTNILAEDGASANSGLRAEQELDFTDRVRRKGIAPRYRRRQA